MQKQKNSIVPDIIKLSGITFFDDQGMQVNVCEIPFISEVPSFSIPYVVIDSYAKKPEKEPDISIIDADDLKKLGYEIVSIKTNKGWRHRQQVIYRIQDVYDRIPGAKKLRYIPIRHRVEKDIANNRIRIIGPNSGFPHYVGPKGGSGPWISLK